LVESCNDALIVGLGYLCWDTFHAKYLHLKPLSVRQGVVDTGQGFLVNLIHMDRQASCCVQSAATSFAFEVFSFLVGDENFEVIEITLTVIAPRSSKQLLDIGVAALFLAHDDLD
jgi:hypothetical protein